MGEVKDVAGQQFGRLVAIRCVGQRRGVAHWECQCECGKVCVVAGCDLRRGATKSCGCTRTHGMSGVPEHGVWKKMKQRCENPSNPKFPLYGGRGICVCPRWCGKDGFENFLADMGPRPQKQMQIDRIDVNGNYEPGNCRWTTCKKNNRNRRDNRMLEVNGEKRCMAEWAEIVGVKVGTIWARLSKGWSDEDAVMTPVRVPLRKLE